MFEYLSSLSLSNLLYCASVFLAGYLLSRVVKHLVLPSLLRHTQRPRLRALHILLQGFSKPIPIFIWGGGLYLALCAFPWPTAQAASILAWILRSWRVIFILLISWGLYGACPLSGMLLGDMTGRLDIKANQTLSRFLTRIFQILVVAFAVVALLGEFGFSVTGLITGVGLLGVVVSLAAQESAANLLAGLVIITEKPFVLGDWVTIGSVEGFVEDITFRSTRIRQLDNALITISNSAVCSGVVVNGTNRVKRMYRFTLGVTYATKRQTLEQLMQALREMLASHPKVERDSVLVRLQAFGSSSIDVLVHCYISTVDLPEYLRIQEELNLAVMDIMEQCRVDFAFPSQSVYVESLPATPR